MTTLFNYLLVFNIFAGASTLFRQPFEFYLGYTFIISFLAMYIIRHHSLSFNSNFLAIMIILTVSSLVNVYLKNDTLFLMTKQVLGILVTGTAYYLLLKINNYEIDKLFKIYLRIALVVAAIGIFQEFSYLVKFRIGYDYGWIPLMSKWSYGNEVCGNGIRMNVLKVNSIFTEPSHFAVSMAPAFFVSFLDIFKKNSLSLKSKWGSIIIITGYLLSFSALAYIAALISIFIFIRSKGSRYSILAMIIVPILAFISYSSILVIRSRIDGAMAFFSHPSVTPDMHMSVYSIVSNAFIAFNSFINSFLFGSGLGSHPVSYYEFFNLGVSKGFLQHNYPVVCEGDSGSLFFRLFSETGLFGVIAVFYFIFRFRLKFHNDNPAIISNAAFILFILVLLRQGHYFYNGLFFFVWIYYFAYKISKAKVPELRGH